MSKTEQKNELSPKLVGKKTEGQNEGPKLNQQLKLFIKIALNLRNQIFKQEILVKISYEKGLKVHEF